MRSYDDTEIIFPTMKPLELPKKENTKVDAAPAEAKKEEVIDFSKVEIEPLFKDYVDFETFSKSDFRAVKVKSCEAVKKSKKLLKFVLDDGTGEDRVILPAFTNITNRKNWLEKRASPSRTCRLAR